MAQGLKNRRKYKRRKERQTKWREFWIDIGIAFAFGAGGTAVIFVWMLLT